MTKATRARFAESIFAAGSAGALGVGIAALDDRVRGYMAHVLTSDPSSELVLASTRVQRLTRVVMEAVGNHGSEHAALVLLVLASLGLLLFMCRT